jgi:hypothetical protein
MVFSISRLIVIGVLAAHLYIMNFTYTVRDLFVNLAGKYQKMNGMMKCGKSYEMFSIMRMYNSRSEVTVILLVSLEHIICSSP